MIIIATEMRIETGPDAAITVAFARFSRDYEGRFAAIAREFQDADGELTPAQARMMGEIFAAYVIGLEGYALPDGSPIPVPLDPDIAVSFPLAHRARVVSEMLRRALTGGIPVADPPRSSARRAPAPAENEPSVPAAPAAAAGGR